MHFRAFPGGPPTGFFRGQNLTRRNCPPLPRRFSCRAGFTGPRGGLQEYCWGKTIGRNWSLGNSQMIGSEGTLFGNTAGGYFDTGKTLILRHPVPEPQMLLGRGKPSPECFSAGGSPAPNTPIRAPSGVSKGLGGLGGSEGPFGRGTLQTLFPPGPPSVAPPPIHNIDHQKSKSQSCGTQPDFAEQTRPLC